MTKGGQFGIEDNSKSLYTDQYFMQIALQEAKKGYDAQEVPIGAVVVLQNKIIAKGYNQGEQLQDATAHAEIIALTAASNYLGSKYLTNCTLYVTLEPCLMCSGAIYWTQLGRLVFGANDNKKGFLRYNNSPLHPCTEVQPHVLKLDCRELLSDFFQKLRS